MLVLWRNRSLQKDCKLGHDDDDDQFDGYDRKVGHMHNTLVTESNVTSSMMEKCIDN